jgi:P pilus assembly chaperone PapD
MRGAITAIAIALAVATLPAMVSAQGYQVQPMLATIAPSGPNSRLTMTIRNSGAVPVTLELTPFRATVDEAGTPTRIDEEKDVLIYPAQTSIEPGKEQTVQVRYIGSQALTEARMYGVRVSQLPISAAGFVPNGSASGVSSDVKMSFNFLSHIIVSPENAKATMTVEDAGRAPNGDLMLRIRNSGTGIAVLNATDFTVTDSTGKAVTVAPDDLKIGNFSAFMPGQSRTGTIAAKDLTGLVGPIKPTLSVQ